jgi:hypothetical protein
MFDFRDALAEAGNECLEHFGEPIFINGIEVRAIFEDELFEEEQGTFRKTTLSIKKADIKFFKEGDEVVVRDRHFRIVYIPDVHEALIDLELKDA